jgi:hypothetical protein
LLASAQDGEHARIRRNAAELADRVRDRFDRVEIAISPAGGPELATG